METRKKSLREYASLKFAAAIICTLSLVIGFFSAVLCVICWQNNVFFEKNRETYLNNVTNNVVNDAAERFGNAFSELTNNGGIDVTFKDGKVDVNREDYDRLFSDYVSDDLENFAFMLVDENGNTVFSTIEGCDSKTGIPGYNAIATDKTVIIDANTGETKISRQLFYGYINAFEDANDTFYNEQSKSSRIRNELYGMAFYSDGTADYVLLMSDDGGVQDDGGGILHIYGDYWYDFANGKDVTFDYYTVSDLLPTLENRANGVNTVLSTFDEEVAVSSAVGAAEEAPDYDRSPDTTIINDEDRYLPLLVITEAPVIKMVRCGVLTYISENPENIDAIFFATKSTAIVAKYVSLYPIALIASVICLLISVFYLCCTCGYRYPADGPKPCWFDRIPIELFVIVGAVLITFAYETYIETVYHRWIFAYYNTRIATLAMIITMPVLLSVFITLAIMTLSVRFKTRTFIRSSVCGWVMIIVWRLLKLIWHVVSRIKLVWKIVFLMAGFTLFEIFVFVVTEGEEELFIVVMTLMDVMLTVLLMLWALGFTKIRDYVHRAAQGNVDMAIDKEFLPGDLKKTAVDLEGVGEGVKLAVEERLRSERLKTELITNVSHDLKTPLTSIVNYIDILSKDEIESSEAREHIEIIKRQSAKMKKLIEDLVEVSKASSGNISANLERTDVNLLLSQSIAEYAEKFEAAKLESVVKIPEKSMIAKLDGRLMWRVLDNLLNNICKYAMSDTRVYITLEEGDGQAIITFKNISRVALNISPDELTERFVRGDSSRNTEGSGLGLSIAKSLCDLQSVGFRLSIDGDLFKASLTIPLCGDEELLAEQDDSGTDGEEGDVTNA